MFKMPGKPVKAIIFDMDGVLVNTEPHHLIIEKKLFADLGLKISEEEHAGYLGKSSFRMWTEIAERHNLAEKPQLLAMRNSDAIIRYFSTPGKIDLFPGVINTLENIFSKGIPMAIASSSESSVIDMFISLTGLEKYFEHKVSTEIVGKSKPEPDVYLFTSWLLSVDPSLCLVIEDSPNGIIAAKSAGMHCISYKADIHRDIDQSMADDSFSDFSLLPELLAKYMEI
jgi:HAD superfamily hydrolase (TIGR01509 family)